MYTGSVSYVHHRQSCNLEWLTLITIAQCSALYQVVGKPLGSFVALAVNTGQEHHGPVNMFSIAVITRGLKRCGIVVQAGHGM